MDKKKFTKGIAYVGMGIVAMALQKFLLIPILTKNLGAEDYGAWTNIMNTVILLAAVASIGMGPTIIRFLSAEKDKKEISRDFFLVFGITLLSSVILSIACYFSSNSIALFILKNMAYSHFIKIACALIIIETWNVIFIALYKALKLFKTYTSVYIAYSIIELFLFWYLLSTGFKLMSIIIASIVIKILLVIAGLVATKFKVGWHRPNFKKTGHYLAYGLPLTLTPFYNWVIRVSDQYVIGFFYSAKEIGIYSLHYSLSYVLYNLTLVIIFVLSPTITELWEQKKIKEVKECIKYSYKYLMMLLIPSVVGCFTLYESVIRNIATREFLTTGFLLLILGGAMIFSSIFALLQNILLLLNKTAVINFITLALALVNLVLNIILIPRIGLFGAAISTLITFISLAFLSLVYTYNEFKFDFMLTTIVKFVISAIVMSFMLSFFEKISLFALLGQIAFGAVIYFSSLLMLKAVSIEEVKFFLRFYKKV